MLIYNETTLSILTFLKWKNFPDFCTSFYNRIRKIFSGVFKTKIHFIRHARRKYHLGVL